MSKPVLTALGLLLMTGGGWAQTTTRVSVTPGGEAGDHVSLTRSRQCLSYDGRFVVFTSGSTDLVDGPVSGEQVYIHDRRSGQTTLVSKSDLDIPGNARSTWPSISGNGRWIVFASDADNLIAADTNGFRDVFLHDRLLETTSRISVDPAGSGGDAASGIRPSSISHDGRRVVFASKANNLDPADGYPHTDVFLHERLTTRTTLVSKNTWGHQANRRTHEATISGDGRLIAFTSFATNLVPGDTNGARDVFLHDPESGQTVLAVTKIGGGYPEGGALQPALSYTGRYLVFLSPSRDLVAQPIDFYHDVFVRDLSAKTTELISQSTTGEISTASSFAPSISADGRFVAFSSDSRGLHPSNDLFHIDVFLRDRTSQTTSMLSLDSYGLPADGESGVYWAGISGNGCAVAFESSSAVWAPLVSGPFPDRPQVYVRSLNESIDSILLAGPPSAPTGASLTLSWSAAPPLSQYRLYVSRERSHSVRKGHPFDIGRAAHTVSTGQHPLAGTGAWSQLTIPTSLSGRTLYFEVRADTSEQVFDSNALQVDFF